MVNAIEQTPPLSREAKSAIVGNFKSNSAWGCKAACDIRLSIAQRNRSEQLDCIVFQIVYTTTLMILVHVYQEAT